MINVYIKPISLCLALLVGLVLSGGTLPANEAILTVYSGGNVFNDTIKGIEDELKDDFILHRMIITEKSTILDIQKQMDTIQPALTVLMDNRAILLFKGYQDKLPAEAPVTPSISLMAVDVETAIKDLKNAAGISYEIPMITSLVHLRAMVDMPITKIGIIYRPFLSEFVKENSAYCRKEGITVYGIKLPEDSNRYKKLVQSALNVLLDTQKVDVLWIPNDNLLLDKQTVEDVWIPLCKRHKVPVIVGVEVFVNPKLDFGTFAVLPDHVALGSQVAQMILEVKEKKWLFKRHETSPPVSIRKIINIKQAGIRYRISAENLQNFDEILK